MATLKEMADQFCRDYPGPLGHGDRGSYLAGAKAALEMVKAEQPVTALHPRDDRYDNGYFDGVMDYRTRINRLIPTE